MKIKRFYGTPKHRRVIVEYEHNNEEGWYMIPVGEATFLRRSLDQAIKDAKKDSQ